MMNRRSLEVVQRLFGQPLAMDPRYAANLYRRVLNGLDSAVPIDDDASRPETEEERGVLVIPIRGMIVHHWTDGIGGYGMMTPTEWLIQTLDAAEADDSVAGVVLDIDSGGGMAAGTPEAAERIFRFRESGKPIVAVANSFAASAAYYLGAAASKLYVIGSGEVGSIGTIMMHEDVTELFEKMGIKIQFIRATDSKNKARVNPFEPLSVEERERVVEALDTINRRFLGDVERFRALEAGSLAALSEFGRTFLSEEAVQLGLVDGVRTVPEVIAEMEAAAVPAEDEAGGEPGDAVRALPGGAEVRSLDGMEVRAASEGQKLEGVALRFGSRSRDLGGFVEEFGAGAFGASLETDDLRVIWQHDRRCVFGRVRAGTARVWEADGAVRYEATPPDAQWARDAMESIRRGDVNQNSFAFRVEKGGEKWERRDGQLVRTVTKARLIEVGPQTNAAYEDTTVAVRGMNAYLAEERKVALGTRRLALAKSKMRAA